MRLIIDIRSLDESSLTGVGYYTRSLLREMCASDDTRLEKVYVVSSGLVARRDELALNENCARVKSIHMQLPNKLLNMFWSIGSYPPLLKNMRDADYLWLPNMNFLPKKIPIPYALTVHDVSFLRNPSWYSPKQRAWHRAIRFKMLITNADKIITVSKYTKDDVLDLFPNIKETSIRVIYPGLDNLSTSEQLAVSPHIDRPPYLLYVGTIEPRKNIDAILKAYEYLRSIRNIPDLILIGKPGYRSKKIMSTSISQNIHYMRYVSDKEKIDLISHALLLIWPSFYEGFGFPPVEASRYAVPVLTSYRTSIPEVMGMTAHYANPYNYKELAHMIDAILMGRANVPGRNMAKSPDQTWRKSCSELIDVITN